jgi:hypothetical protein
MGLLGTWLTDWLVGCEVEDGATHVVILAWNFQEEIIRQMGVFVDRGGCFVQIIPKPGVLEPVSLRV